MASANGGGAHRSHAALERFAPVPCAPMEPPGREAAANAAEASAVGSRPPVVFKVWDAVVVFVAGQIGGILFASVGYEITGDDIDDAGALTLAFALAGQFLAYGLVVWWYCRRRATGSLRRDLGFAVHLRDWWAVPVGTACAVALGLVVLPLRELVDENQSVVEDLLDASGAELAVIAIAAGLLAPVFEELVFRGVLLRSLLPRMGPNWAIAVSALAFGAVHFLGGSALGTVAVLPALVGIGAISGVLAVRSGELSQSILLHVGFNLLAVVGALAS
jgi:membrane protease YdiL (CAAX protease family)